MNSSPSSSANDDGPWALFLDFDGTLVEIVDRPDAVAADPALPGLLGRLSRQLGGALAVVSGRPIAFLDDKLAPYGGDAAGLHGIETRIGGHLDPCRPEAHPDLRRGVEHLHETFREQPEIIVEDKGCSVAVHWRLAPKEADRAKAIVDALAGRLGADYRIQFGKAVAEILPARSGKGPVIERFMQSAPYRGRRPIFVGDDLTDENGFVVVNRLGGVAIRIGTGETVARYRLASPGALRECLECWARQNLVRMTHLPAV